MSLYAWSLQVRNILQASCSRLFAAWTAVGAAAAFVLLCAAAQMAAVAVAVAHLERASAGCVHRLAHPPSAALSAAAMPMLDRPVVGSESLMVCVELCSVWDNEVELQTFSD